jgi:hypothetical protein
VFSFDWRRTYWVPMFQFDLTDLSVRAGLQQVIAEFDNSFDNWKLAMWFTQPNLWLNRPWFPDGRTSNELALLKVVPSNAEYWDAPHSKMVRLFAMAVSVVAGKSIGMGEHEKLTHLSTGQTTSHHS